MARMEAPASRPRRGASLVARTLFGETSDDFTIEVVGDAETSATDLTLAHLQHRGQRHRRARAV